MEMLLEPPLLAEAPSLVEVPPLPPDGLIMREAVRMQIPPEELVAMTMTQAGVLQYRLDELAIPLKTIPPHSLHGPVGVREADVLVIGKCPNVEEIESQRHSSGARGRAWQMVLERLGADYSDWMLTNACWCYVDPKYLQWKDIWWKEWQHPLALTINAVKPKYLLLWGADAMKAAFTLANSGGRLKSFKDVRGHPIDYVNGVKAVVATSPANVFAEPSTLTDMERDLETFVHVVRGTDSGTDNYRILEIDHQGQLDALVDRLIAEGVNTFALDCEWGGGTWRTGQLRTIQLSWSDSDAAVVILRRQGMKAAFSPAIYTAIVSLQRLFKREGVKIIGHNLRGDLRWLKEAGLDLMEEFINGGFDTMLGHHLCFESAEQQLELCALRLLRMPRYDLELRRWLTDNGLGKADMAEVGYGTIPDTILHPYAGLDALASFRLYKAVLKEMDRWPGVKELYYDYIHPLNLPLDEMETTGVVIDEDRVRLMAELCGRRREELAGELRTELSWPDFNPRSVFHVRELLFGWRQKGKDGQPVSCAPPGTKLFNLQPVKSTGTSGGTPWEKVLSLPANERGRFAPSTDAESVGILAADNDGLETLQRYKVVDQLGKNFLREPVEDEETGEEGWDGGVGAFIEDDGRLRTSFRPTLETGRYATSPNLQNWPKRQEPQLLEAFTRVHYVVTRDRNFGSELEYFDGFGFSPNRGAASPFSSKSQAEYVAVMHTGTVREVRVPDPQYCPLRSVMRASPGHVLLEADWNQAELWTMSALAGDEDFLHALSVSDVHCEMVLKMFGTLKVPGRDQYVREFTAKQLKRMGKEPGLELLDTWRNLAKTVVFGIPYGRGSGAILRQIKKEGVKGITQSEVQGWIDVFYQTYPRIYDSLQASKRAVVNPGYVQNPWGRYRRAGLVEHDDVARAAAERELANFCIQSTVADAMTAALINLWTYKRYVDTSVDYRILLSVHDAVLLEAPIAHAQKVVEEVFPACMVHGVRVPKIGLQYTLGDIDVQLRWGVKEDPKRLFDLGIPRHLCGFKD